MKDILKGVILAGLFMIPLITLYVANQAFFPYITGKNFTFRIIVEVIFALYVILAFLAAEYRPRFSWILASFTGFMTVMLVSTMFAEHRGTAFWSNFERMDGYVTLIHVFLYFLVLSAMLQSKKMWHAFLHVSVVVAAIVAYMGLVQLAGPTVRVDSSLGNAAYMAIYMLFHIFITAYLLLQTKVLPYRFVYGLLITLFVFVLLQTGTRGTAIGLAAGILATVAYIGFFATRHPQLRKYAVGAVGVVIILLGAFYSLRDSAAVQSSPALARIANIDLGEDLRTRSIIWNMSLEGIKERPIVGWGMGNFNYVFNAEYDPRLYEQEQWFDRVHNLAFDWLIAGGILGLLAYISIFAALFYYLVIRSWSEDSNFSIVERGVLFGLLVGYLTHNLVVFDNIISYIFFATILALMHQRYSRPWPAVHSFKLPTPIVTQIVAPIVLVVLVVVVYVVNVPNIRAAFGLIDALNNPSLQGQLDEFNELLSLRTFGRQEIVEQLAQRAMGLSAATPDQVDPELKQQFLDLAEAELLQLTTEKPGDARLHVFLASYYRATGNQEKAREQLATARTFSPRKQAIILQQGAVEIAVGNYAAAHDFFKVAYELDEANLEAKEYYMASLYFIGNFEAAQSLLETSSDEFLNRVAASDFVLSALHSTKQNEALAEFYERRVLINGQEAQNWASLAFVYYQMSIATTTTPAQKSLLTEKAITTLARGADAVPAFSSMASCVTANLKAGRAPETGCQ